jgi:hypothetical protein
MHDILKPFLHSFKTDQLKINNVSLSFVLFQLNEIRGEYLDLSFSISPLTAIFKSPMSQQKWFCIYCYYYHLYVFNYYVLK